MIVRDGVYFSVFVKVPGYRKDFADLCKQPPDMVYVGWRSTEEAARKLDENPFSP